jgi:hypothetical protein
LTNRFSLPTILAKDNSVPALINHIPTPALVDSGAIKNYVSSHFAQKNALPLEYLPKPLEIILGDSETSIRTNHQTTPLSVSVGDITTCEQFVVAPSLAYPIILGDNWLSNANPVINWRQRTVLPELKPYSSYMESAKTFVPSALNPEENFKRKEHLMNLLNNRPDCPATYDSNPLGIPDFLYNQCQQLFSEKAAEILPEHRKFDMNIELKDEKILPAHGRIYNLTEDEDKVLFDWIQDMLKKGYIRRSQSPFGAPCFFTTKKDDSLRLCMDYRRLNELTKSGKYPMPLITELINRVSKGKIFSTMDLRNAFNLIRIAAGQEHKTAFITKYGKFEFLVMPFGLAGSPGTFQAMMNEIFHECFDFCQPYLDDLTIFSATPEEHVTHLQRVCDILAKHNLFVKPSKCQFFKNSVTLLGYVVDSVGTYMETDKVETISTWPEPKNVKQLRSFLGFTNFYRSFIPGYSKILQPLFALLKNDAKYTWSTNESQSFHSIKEAFTKPTVLHHPDNSLPFVLETDASDFAIAAILSQVTASGLSPIAFFSRQMIPAERNYDIYDKELLAIVEAFKKWRHILMSANINTKVLADHLNLKYFMTTKNLTRRQARWYNFLTDFAFTVDHQSGSLNRADLPSRREDYKFDPADENKFQIFSSPSNIALEDIKATISLNLLLHCESLDVDYDSITDWPLLIADFLDTGIWNASISPAFKKQLIDIHLPWFMFKDDRFCRLCPDKITTKLYVTAENRSKLVMYYHENLAHLKTDSIFDIIDARYWWPMMKRDINAIVIRCPKCQLSAPAGDGRVFSPRNVQALPNVPLPFQRIGLDFVGPLPITKNGNRYLITAIDYASRWPKAVPVKDMSTATVAKFLFDHIIADWGSPLEIITDRGKYFLQEGLQEFFKRRQIDHRPTSPYHPQTNGMVERMHAPLKHGLRTLAIEHPEDWDDHALTQTLIALRIRTHSVTKFSPFKLLYGLDARLESDHDIPHAALRPLSEIEQLEETGDIDARALEDIGQFRAAANARSITAAKVFQLREKIQHNQKDYFFSVGDMVKLKKHNPTSLQFNWKGPYHIVGLGYPGTYYLMNPQGYRLESTQHQNELAPWLAPVIDNVDFFYDATARRTTALECPQSEAPPSAARPWAFSLAGGTVIPPPGSNSSTSR